MGAKKRKSVVIMGDLVSSRQARSTQKLHRQFNQAVGKTNEVYEAALLSPLTITLGDEFQGLCHEYEGAIGIVRDMRLRLLKADIECRFVIGSATVQTPLNTEQAWNMMGPGLAEARELIGKKDESAYLFSLPEQPVMAELLNALGYVLTKIELDWTPRQREMVIELLSRPDVSVADIAAAKNVSESNVHKVLRAAGRDKVERIQTAISEAMQYLDGGKRA